MRSANLSRKTTETEIAVELNLDGNGRADISTGIGFLDHMLHSFAIHGLFDLKLQAKGDLHVDPHHTIEDVALVLGSAFDQALGERVGIVRIADCYVPMDEALAHIALDLSGRPYAVMQVQWNTPYINGIPTLLFIHFFETFATTLRGNIHGRVLYGRDDHHQVEALFKAFARALEKATRLEPRREDTIPSAKGKLG